MGLIDDLKARADSNADGKITKEDLEGLNSEENKAKIEALKQIADTNKDGKIDLDDAKGLNLGQVVDDIKGVFGK